jgi:hypothetical protein
VQVIARPCFFMHENANSNPLYYEDFGLVFVDRNMDGVDDAYLAKPQLKVWVANNALKVEIPNDDFGDPANGIVKQLKVDYTFDSKEKSKTVKDGKTLKIDR